MRSLLLCLPALAACSAVLDFEDECKVDQDCAALGLGLGCDQGFCVPRELVEDGSCDRDSDCARYGDTIICNGDKKCADRETQAPIGGFCDRIFGEDPRTATPDTVITIGALLPRSGALGSFGDGMENGVRLAVTEINQSGGVLGKKLAVVSCDDATDSTKAIRAARHLVDVARVDAIIGAGGSGVTIDTFNGVAKDARVLMVSPSATSQAITNLPDNGLLWRTAPSDAVQGRTISEYILAKGYDKVAIVNRNDAYGNTLATEIQRQLCDLSERFTCVTNTSMFSGRYSDQAGPQQVAEQTAIITGGEQPGLDAFGPDAVVLIGFVQDGVDFMNLAQGRGYDFILTDGMRDTALMGTSPGQVAVADPSLLCELVGTVPASPTGTMFTEFARAYDALFKTAPPTFSASAYDATYLIAFAYAAAKGAGINDPDGRALAEGLGRLSSGPPVIQVGVGAFGTALTQLGNPTGTIDVVGVSGPLDFDAAVGEAPSGVEMWRVDPATKLISNLGVVYEGQNQYNFDAVLEAEPVGSCVPAR